ncbi:glycosyltransferase family 2 protein [Burkholderia sp. BCC0419]|uniref:glycosyltransferase family 2 protein n=1 Tax=Burkholderia sp. BCC0419 TaxID=486878 RepID=UPI001FC88370|nr:glycosyltransferase family 2 protein [Burkholderia sp. BCC0419]
MPLHDTTITGPASLRIQSVLYNNSQEHIDTALDSIARAADLAIASGALSSVEVALGDCSPEPVFTLDEIEERATRLRLQGIARIQYTFFNANLGSAAGQNRLLGDLHTDLVLILNPDTVVAPNIFVELVRPMGKRDVGIVEARQVPIEHPKDYDQVTGETSWATTACALVSAAVAKEVNGFDSDSFFLYCDDVDFSWRVRLAGYKVVFQPSATLFHDKRLSTAGRWIVGGAEEYYSAEAAMILAHKFSNTGLADRIERQLLANGSEVEKKAARKYRELKDAGKLPAQIDREHRVAQFIDGFYAKHRF